MLENAQNESTERHRHFCVLRVLTLKKESRAPFSMNSVRIMTGQLAVMMPSRWMMLGCWNWPMIDASDRKSRLCLSVYPPLRVLMAT